MTIDLMTIPAIEAERVAYAEGFTGTATLFVRIADLEKEPDYLCAELLELEDDKRLIEDALNNVQNELSRTYSKLRDAENQVESLQAELSALRWLER